jgi:predicted HAD superfamily Cof-like phosphohydrolase
MNKTPYEMVGEFHQTMGQPWHQKGRIPAINAALIKLRLKLITEELEELTDAILNPESEIAINIKQSYDLLNTEINIITDEDLKLDIIEIADALGDINYVVNGAAHAFNINLDCVTEEIHRSNMSKLGEDGKPIYRTEDGKILKGPNYFKPNIKEILDKTN